MSGTSNRHNRIATNLIGSLVARLRGKRCEAFHSDTKVRIQLPTHTRFYYPDAMVVCHPNSENDSYQDAPTLIVEVLSGSTRRTDEGEKRDAYQTIPSLVHYWLVEQEEAVIVAYRRTDQGFVREVYQGLDAVIGLSDLEIELPLAEIYEHVPLGPESESPED